MDNSNKNNQNPQSTKQKTIAFAASAVAAIIIVGLIAYVVLSKIKGDKSQPDVMSQEQFESSPVISSSLQSECQQSAVKLAQLKKIDDLEAEFKAHVENCREIYFSIDGESKFRKEGMYADLAVDLAHYAYKENKAKSVEILNFAKTLKPWEFYLGPVSCDSHHVLDAYLESLELPNEKTCIRAADYKQKLFSELQNRNFSIFRSLISNQDVVWMGQPESDVGCPEKISTIIDVVKKLTEGPINIEEPKTDENNGTDFYVSIKSNQAEKVALVFRPEGDCLQLKSILVPNLEISE